MTTGTADNKTNEYATDDENNIVGWYDANGEFQAFDDEYSVYEDEDESNESGQDNPAPMEVDTDYIDPPSERADVEYSYGAEDEALSRQEGDGASPHWRNEHIYEHPSNFTDSSPAATSFIGNEMRGGNRKWRLQHGYQVVCDGGGTTDQPVDSKKQDRHRLLEAMVDSLPLNQAQKDHVRAYIEADNPVAWNAHYSGHVGMCVGYGMVVGCESVSEALEDDRFTPETVGDLVEETWNLSREYEFGKGLERLAEKAFKRSEDIDV